MDVLNKLQNIFRDIFDDGELALERETSPDDIADWDSLAQVNIIASCGVEFGVKFELNEIIEIENVGDIIDIIERKLSR